MYTIAQRNFDNVQFEELRKKIDKTFNGIHDELSECYYDFWKHGESKPFVSGDKTYDVQETVEESKKLFEELHGLIFKVRDVKFHEENLKQNEKDKIDEDKYRYERNEKNEIIIDNIEVAEQKIEKLKNEGIELTIK